MTYVRAQEEDIVNAMETYGGSFVVALAAAYRRADGFNRARIVSAFTDYWDRYAGMAQREIDRALGQDGGVPAKR